MKAKTKEKVSLYKKLMTAGSIVFTILGFVLLALKIFNFNESWFVVLFAFAIAVVSNHLKNK